MKTIFKLVWFQVLLFTSCVGNGKFKIPTGVWKLGKIEVLRNNEIKTTIDTGYQYWKFYKSDSIEIGDRQQIQKCLKIKPGRNFFKSIDSNSGNTIDKFVIEKCSTYQLELSSTKILDETSYTVVYYLERMDELENEVY